MRWRTYSDEFRALQVVCPSVEEQDEIVAYLDEKCGAIDRIIAAKQQLMSSSCPLAHVIILNWKENREGLDGAIRRGLCYTRKKEYSCPTEK